MKPRDIKVVVLISALVSLNILIWYEIFGFKVAILVILFEVSAVLHK